MAGFLLLTPFLLLSFSLHADSKEVTRGHSVAGVFLLMEGETYTFNFTAAQAACLSLNVTMATTAQMERALQRGLETCKFGWTREQIAVIPRQTADSKCGAGKTGLARWYAAAHRPFGAFCFDAAASQDPAGASSAGPPAATTRAAASSSPHTPLWETTATPSPSTPPGNTDPPERSTVTSAPAQPAETTAPSLGPSSALPPLTYTSSSSSHVIASLPSVTSSTSPEASSESVLLQSVSPEGHLGAVSVALIILGVILLILAAAGATCYYKLNISPVWARRQLKDDIDTEMWRQNNSEMNLHGRHGGEEEEEEEEEEDGEEADRKYSSDIMLCVHPDMRTNCSQ